MSKMTALSPRLYLQINFRAGLKTWSREQIEKFPDLRYTTNMSRVAIYLPDHFLLKAFYDDHTWKL